MTETVSTERLEEIKAIAVSFFQWWWNAPGTNTEDGFDEWASGPGAELLATRTQEPAEWRPEDMVIGLAYESKYFGLVTYRGIDDFHGDKTFSFDIGRGQMRYTKRLNEFLFPRRAHDGPATSVAQSAPIVTDEMATRFAQELWKLDDAYARSIPHSKIKSALTAAISTPEEQFECPINQPGCTKDCGSYGCGN